MGNVKAGTASNGAGFDVGVAMISGNLHRPLAGRIHVMFQINNVEVNKVMRFYVDEKYVVRQR